MQSSAIYAGSFDPITHGHINIIKRAMSVFYPHFIVAVGNNPHKKYTFSLEEREALLKKALENLPVIVKSFEGLLVDFAYEHGVKTIVRGVRNTPDFSFEQIINDVNTSQQLGIDTHILIADQNLSHVSSSAVKELQINQGKNIIEYVPMVIKKAMEERLSGQYIVGLTGVIGAGKSYVAKKLQESPEHWSAPKLDVHNIDLDLIGHEILEKALEPVYQEVRKDLIDFFGSEIAKPEGFVNTRALGNKIFNDSLALAHFNRTLREPMFLMLRRKIRNLKGIIIINSALIEERDILDFVNNNVILVNASHDVQVKRLEQRGYSPDEIRRRVDCQLTAALKEARIHENIQLRGYGTVLKIQNDGEPLDIQGIREKIAGMIA